MDSVSIVGSLMISITEKQIIIVDMKVTGTRWTFLRVKLDLEITIAYPKTS